jgi:hypothetical protein
LPAQFIHAIAPLAHLVPRKSWLAVTGVKAFFNGTASVLFAAGLSIQSVSNFSFETLQNVFSPIA